MTASTSIADIDRGTKAIHSGGLAPSHSRRSTRGAPLNGQIRMRFALTLAFICQCVSRAVRTNWRNWNLESGIRYSRTLNGLDRNSCRFRVVVSLLNLHQREGVVKRVPHLTQSVGLPKSSPSRRPVSFIAASPPIIAARSATHNVIPARAIHPRLSSSWRSARPIQLVESSSSL